MRIQFKLLTVLAVALLLSVISVLVHFETNKQEQKALRSSLVSELGQNIQTLISMNSESLQGSVTDYSFWNEMVRYVHSPEPEWAEENLATMLKSFKLDAVYVFDKNHNLVYINSATEAYYSLIANSLSATFFDSLYNNRRLHSFFSIGQTIVEIAGATIHPSDDPFHTSEPQGFLLIARAWNSNYLKTMEKITSTKISFTKPDENTVQNPYSLYFSFPVKDFTGKIITTLQAEKKIPYLKMHQEAARTSFLTLVLSAILILIIFTISATIWIYRPLRLVETILYYKDMELIKKLKTSGREFRRIGLLIQNIFYKNEQIIKAKEKIEAANRLKSNFISNINHEIRTPINGISGFTELLVELPSDDVESKYKYAQFIKTSCNDLINIVNDVLDISLIETKEIKISKTQFSLRRLINSLVPEVQQKIKESGKTQLELRANPANVKPDLIYADKYRIERILKILSGNAIKFTHTGYIEIGAKSDGKSGIILYVKDTGIGIANDKLDVVFESFRQADESFSRCYGGNGLGLAICKGLANAMDGSIWVQSELNRGSVFFVALPNTVAPAN